MTKVTIFRAGKFRLVRSLRSSEGLFRNLTNRKKRLRAAVEDDDLMAQRAAIRALGYKV